MARDIPCPPSRPALSRRCSARTLAFWAALGLGLTGLASAPPASDPPAPAPPPPDDPAARDLARIQGVWRLESQVVNGERSPEAKIRPWILVVEGDIYNPGSRDSSVEYLVRLDPTRNPKAIDFVPKDGDRRGRVLRGIYALTDTRFQICRVLDPDLDRPVAIDSGPNSGLVVITWTRERR